MWRGDDLAKTHIHKRMDQRQRLAQVLRPIINSRNNMRMHIYPYTREIEGRHLLFCFK